MIENQTKHRFILAIDAATMARSKVDLTVALQLRQAIIKLSFGGDAPKMTEKKTKEGLIEGVIFTKEVIA